MTPRGNFGYLGWHTSWKLEFIIDIDIEIEITFKNSISNVFRNGNEECTIVQTDPHAF